LQLSTLVLGCFVIMRDKNSFL